MLCVVCVRAVDAMVKDVKDAVRMAALQDYAVRNASFHFHPCPHTKGREDEKEGDGVQCRREMVRGRALQSSIFPLGYAYTGSGWGLQYCTSGTTLAAGTQESGLAHAQSVGLLRHHVNAGIMAPISVHVGSCNGSPVGTLCLHPTLNGSVAKKRMRATSREPCLRVGRGKGREHVPCVSDQAWLKPLVHIGGMGQVALQAGHGGHTAGAQAVVH